MKVSLEKSPTITPPALTPPTTSPPFFAKVGGRGFFEPGAQFTARPLRLPPTVATPGHRVRPTDDRVANDRTAPRPGERVARQNPAPSPAVEPQTPAPPPPVVQTTPAAAERNSLATRPSPELLPPNHDTANTPAAAPTNVPAALPAPAAAAAPAAENAITPLPERPTGGPAAAGSPSQPLQAEAGTPAADLPTSGAGEKAAPGSTMGALGQIAGAPKSAEQALALEQAVLINNDFASNNAQITQLAAARQQQLAGQFVGARQGLAGFFTNAIGDVQAFISGRQAEVTTVATRALGAVRAAVVGTLASAQAVGVQIRARISQVLESVTTAVQGRVEGVANQVTNLIGAVPLPDIPGISQIRNAAANLLNRAAGLITGALGRFTSFVQLTFAAGMSLLDSLLSGISGVLDTALSVVSAAILNLIATVGLALSRAAALVGATLRQALLTLVEPLLRRIQTQIFQLLDGAAARTRALLRANRQHYLAALAAAVTPGTAPQPAPPAAPGSRLAAIRQFGRDALQNSRLLLETFRLVVNNALAAVLRLLVTVAAQLMGGITGAVAQVIQTISRAVAQAGQLLNQVLQAVGSYVRELLAAFAQSLTVILTYTRTLVEGVVDRLIEFVLGGLSRIRSLISSFVQNLLLGRGAADNLPGTVGQFTPTLFVGPAFRGPAPLPPGAIAALILLALVAVVEFFGGAVIVVGSTVIILIAGATITTTVGVVVLVAVVLLLLLALLAYLLYKWLTTPVPPKLPPPRPCTITTRTLITAPDGTADSRRTVGVNERVELSTSGPATWSASRGTVVPVVGATTIWTAPDPGGSSTIKATPTTGGPCSVAFQVLAPTARELTWHSDTAYVPGLAGSGFVATIVVVPRSVSFSRIEVMEGAVSAIAVGYYDKVLGWNGIVHPPTSRWLPLNNANGGLSDTVGSKPPGTAGPFSGGTFFWPIPQLYRVVGGPGSTEFSRGNHIQQMFDATGKETTAKEGATRPARTP